MMNEVIVAIVMIVVVAYLLVERSFIAERQRHRGCRKLFGIIPRDHVQPRGYGKSVGYGTIVGGGIDGTGRKHGSVMVGCERCGERYSLVKVHQHADK